jgi:glycerophosphoryl diester phosphodiesterase
LDRETSWHGARPLVIAHRGACRRAPENTLAAFRAAADLGADGVELDTKLTADGRVVVMHDQTLDRTTAGKGPIREHTLADIKALEAGAHFSAAFTGEPIPTLAEVFQSVGSKLLINVEIGNYATPTDRLPEAVVDIVLEHGLQESVVLSSFNPIALRRARKRGPAITRALLVGPQEKPWLRAVFAWLAPYAFVHPYASLVDAAGVSHHHRAGHKVIVWGTNDPARMRELLQMGVDGLITDLPELGLEAVADVFPGD